jgi:predicted ester cyclase
VVAGYAKPWVDSFSDSRIIQDIYYDAGDTVVAELIGKGTNDGYVGSLPPTGLPVELPYVHILHFNDEGKVNFGRAYFDQLNLMQQLGYA